MLYYIQGNVTDVTLGDYINIFQSSFAIFSPMNMHMTTINGKCVTSFHMGHCGGCPMWIYVPPD